MDWQYRHKALTGQAMPLRAILGNYYTQRGQALEPLAITEYERIVKRYIARPGFVTNSVYPNAGYSPDGIDGKTLLEVKCLNGERHENLAKG